MSSKGRFSDVSLSYNANAANLDQARWIFQKEVSELNGWVQSHLSEMIKRPREGIKKVRWSDCEDWSTAKDGPWLNFIGATVVGLDMSPPELSIFKRGVAYLYFETRFDSDVNRFMFRARFENQDVVSKILDETVMEVVRSKGDEMFPNSEQIKSNTAILFKREIGNELFENVNQFIDSAVLVCEEAVDRLFPDSQYHGIAPSIEDEEE